jgi:hypothetical protein
MSIVGNGEKNCGHIEWVVDVCLYDALQSLNEQAGKVVGSLTCLCNQHAEIMKQLRIPGYAAAYEESNDVKIFT